MSSVTQANTIISESDESDVEDSRENPENDASATENEENFDQQLVSEDRNEGNILLKKMRARTLSTELINLNDGCK